MDLNTNITPTAVFYTFSITNVKGISQLIRRL